MRELATMPTADASGTPSQPLVEARQRDTTEAYRADTGKRGLRVCNRSVAAHRANGDRVKAA